MSNPLILDMFCGAGGAAEGYRRAGFDVIGVDIKPQPHYPFPFILGDAIAICGKLSKPIDPRHHGAKVIASNGRSYDWFDVKAIHASPPCQRFSAMTKRWGRESDHPDLLDPTRAALLCSLRPFVIENVIGAPLRNPVMLCGTMFGLQTSEGSQLRRHRLFECSFPIAAPSPCDHNNGSCIGVYGGGQHPDRRRPATIGVWGNAGGHSERDGIDHYGIAARREAMGIDWMTGKELSQSIPPAYTEYLGKCLYDFIKDSTEC